MGKIRTEQIAIGTKNTRQLLSFSGMGVVWKHHLQYCTYVILNAFLGLCLLLYSIYYYIDQIDKIAVIVHHAILLIDVCVASIIGYVWKDQFDNWLDGTYWSYDYQSDIVSKKQNEIKDERGKNLSTMFRYLLLSLIYMLLDLAILATCERYLVNKDILLVYPCWFPFELDNYFVYIAVLLWQELIVTHIGIVVFSSLALSHCIYSYVKAEISLLEYALNTISERAHEMARKHNQYIENQINDINAKILKSCFLKCTRMCAEHHADIIRYFDYGPTVIEIIYFLVFLTGLVVCICTGFALISDNTALKVKFLLIMVIQLIYLFMMCWAPETIAEASVAINDTIYVMQWYNLPKECHSTLKIMMIRSNQPLVMKMWAGKNVDLEGYMSLINASYSYFNMMLATTQ